jgi:hypothetical protein
LHVPSGNAAAWQRFIGRNKVLAMRVIKLDASGWKTIDDYYDAILVALEAPHWHGRNANAMVDSVWGGNVNAIDPPYRIWVVGTVGLDLKIRQEIDRMIEGVLFQYGRGIKDPEPEILFQVDP